MTREEDKNLQNAKEEYLIPYVDFVKVII